MRELLKARGTAAWDAREVIDDSVQQRISVNLTQLSLHSVCKNCN